VTGTAPALDSRADPDERPGTADRSVLPRSARLAARLRRPGILDLLVCLGFLALACWLTHGLWPHPGQRMLSSNPADQILYEWFLAYDTRLWTGDFSLISQRLNVPDGVNMLANTTVIALGALLAPVTALFGAPVTFALIVGSNLAGTAAAWFLLFRRTMGARRLAAAVGGLFCGFAPGMVSQSNSHLHMTAQWLIPVMVWCVVSLVRAAGVEAASGRRIAGLGALLGGLVAVQLFIGEETLFLTALTLVVVSVVYAVRTRPPAGQLLRFVAGMAIAAAVGVLLLAYPLSVQFAGPQSVSGGVFDPHFFSADLAGFVTISPQSIGGSDTAARLTTGAAEYNTFLGWPLVLLVAALMIWLWRDALALACTAGTLVMCGFALGPEIVIDGERTPVDFLFTLMESLPVVDGALPMRFALAAIPLIATLLVIALGRSGPPAGRFARIAVPVAVLAALVPLTPLPLPTQQRPPMPRFYAEGHWRDCVPEGGVLVPVPLATPPEPEPMRYATDALAAYGMPEGFFIGPYGDDRKAVMGTWRRPFSYMLNEINRTGIAWQIDDSTRAQFLRDLARWDADCIVLTDTREREQLDVTLTRLLGPGTPVADATIWRRAW
jgi:hypothetical protein